MRRSRLLALLGVLLFVGAIVIALIVPGGTSRPSATTLPSAQVRLVAHRFGLNPTSGEILTASTGTWTNAPTSYTYQWEQCDAGGTNCSNIAGATASTYAVVAGDVGHTIRVVVVASNSAGAGPPSTSPATGVVTTATGAITFDGSFELGSHTQPTTIQPWGGTPQSFNWQGLNPGAHYFGDFYYDNGTASSPTTGSLFNAASSSLVPPGAGAWSGRIVLPTTPSGPTLTNVTLQGLSTPLPGDLGTTNYYGLMFYIPQGEQINSSDFQGMNLWEQHISNVPTWGAPIALQLHTTGPSAINGTGSSVVIALETGACNSSNSANYVAPFTATAAHGCQYRSNAAANQCNLPSQPNIGAVTCLAGFSAIPPGAVQYGVWNELVFAVNEESSATGSIQSYYKTITSPTWTTGANITGIPTIQWDIATGCGSPPTSGASCGYPAKEDVELYGGAQSAPFSVNIDNEEIGTSLAAVEGTMPTQGITPVAPTNTVIPVVSGTDTQGQLLSATSGTWTGTPSPTFTYQWQDCNTSGASCVSIAAATANTYTLISPDVGHTIRVVVTGTNTAGNASATSPQTAVVIAGGGGGVGTGPSLAECRVGSVLSGALATCGAPSPICDGTCTGTGSAYTNVTVAGSGCGGGSNICPIRVFIPTDLVTNNPAKPVPIVVLFPDGSGCTGCGAWENLSPTGKFIVVQSCPTTTICVPNDTEVRGASGSEDLQVSGVLNYLENAYVNPANGQKLQVDTSRIYATGGSKGGNAAQEVACNQHLESQFAGVSAYSSSLELVPAANSAPFASGSCRAFLAAGGTTVIASPHPIMYQFVWSPQDGATRQNCWWDNNTPPPVGTDPNGKTCKITNAPGDWFMPPITTSNGVGFANEIWARGLGCVSTPMTNTYDPESATTGGQLTSFTFEGCANLASGRAAEAQVIQFTVSHNLSACHWNSCTQSVGTFSYNIATATWDFWTTGNETPS